MNELVISPWIVWLSIGVVFVIIELLTNTFAAFCLTGGCVVGALASLLGLEVEGQLVGAAVGAVVTFLCFRPIMRRLRASMREKTLVSNMDALVGRCAVVTEPDGNGQRARVRIDGDNWQVEETGGQPLAVGDRVEVTGYDSIILKVEKR